MCVCVCVCQIEVERERERERERETCVYEHLLHELLNKPHFHLYVHRNYRAISFAVVS